MTRQPGKIQPELSSNTQPLRTRDEARRHPVIRLRQGCLDHEGKGKNAKRERREGGGAAARRG